jgi:type I restriction enzyme S subunit
MDKLPNGWSFNELSELCVFENGDRGKNYPSKSSFVEDGVPFVNAGNLSNNKIDKINLNYITETHYNRLSSGKLRKGDIVFCLRGSLGKFAVVDREIKGAIASSLVIVRPNEKLDLSFLSAYFQSSISQEYIDLYDNGSAQPNLSAASLKKFKIPIPSLPEQKRIVSKLDALFARIDKSIALLEENIKQTEHLMASALDEIFKNLASKSEVYKVSDFADIKGGKRLPKGLKVQEAKTDYPYIRVADFQDNGTVDLSSLQYITKEAHAQIKRYIINPEDLYISIAGTIGKTGIIPNELKGANLTENAARFVFKSDFDINNKFIYYFTLSDSFNAQISEATKTVAQPKLALTRLKEVTLPIPNIERQNKAVVQFDILSSKTQAIIKEQNDKLTNLKALKESILDKAFKGEL